MDTYAIGISIAMQNGVSAVLSKIQGELLGLNKSVLEASAGFSRLGLAVKGALGVAVGGAMLKGIYDLSKAGDKYIHQLEAMKIAGMSVVEIQSAITAANRVSSTVATTTPTENLKTIGELRNALASADVRPGQKADPAEATREAVLHLETFQRITGIMSSLLSKNGKPYDASGQAFELAKAAEILGLSQDPKKFDAVLEGWTKAIIASKGLLTGSDFFGNVKYLRGAGLGLDMEFLTKQLPVLMQELKTGKGSGQGGGAGNPLASLHALIVGGVASGRAVDALEKIHLLDPKDVIRDHGKIRINAGAIHGSDEFVKNPYKFTTDYLAPAIAKFTNYLDRDAKGELKHPAQFFALMASFGARTAQQAELMMLTQTKRFAGERGLIEAVPDIGVASRELLQNDPVAIKQQFHEQWDRLITDLGKSISPQVNQIILKLANAFKYLSEVVEAHPQEAALFFTVATGFAALFAVMGTAALTLAVVATLTGVFPLTVAAMVAIGGAIYWLSTKVNVWTTIRDSFKGITDAIQTFMDILRIRGFKAAFEYASGGFVTAMNAMQDSILSGLTRMIKELGAWFAGLPRRIYESITGTGQAAPTAAGAPQRWIDVDPTIYGFNKIPAPTSPGPPPSAANANVPGSSASNPIYNHQLNQPTARDMAHSTAYNLAHGIGGPQASTHGFDQRQSPAFSYLGL